MKEINIAKAKDSFSEIVARVSYSGERVLLKRRDKVVAAIVSLEDLEKILSVDGEVRGSLLGASGSWKNFNGLDEFLHRLYPAPAPSNPSDP